MIPAPVVILGGGIGGQAAARILGARRDKSSQAVLVEREAEFSFPPSLGWVMTGDRDPAAITRPMDRLERHGVRVQRASVLRVDAVGRTVETSSGTLSFEKLLIALGAELDPDALPGFREAAHNLYTLTGAVSARDALHRMSGGTVTVLISSMPYKCPAAPYEAALFARGILDRRGVDARIEVHTPEPFPMPSAGPAVGAALRGLIESRGISFHPGRRAVAVDAIARRIAFQEGPESAYDLLLGIPAHRAPAAVRDSGLANESGWLLVDRGTMATSVPGIYAVGDATLIPVGGGKNLPKAGVFAHRQAEVAALNILSELRGAPRRRTFSGHGWCAIETGDGRAGIGSGDFYAPDGPRVRLRSPSRLWHWFKMGFERWWLWRWF